MESKSYYGKQVRNCRKHLGMSQKELADAFGRSESWVSMVERNERQTPLSLIVFLAKESQTTVESLVGAQEPAYTKPPIGKELQAEIAKLSSEQKEKLLELLRAMN